MQTITEEQFKAISVQITNMETVEQRRSAIRPLLDEVQKFIPEAGFYYLMEHETTFHSLQIRFIRNGINFQIYRYDKYYAIMPDMSGFECVDTRYGWPAEENGYKIPYNIGVLSARKVAEKIEYETARYHYFEKINAERKLGIDEFLKAAEGEPIRWELKNKGLIERNGVILEFDFSTGGIVTELLIAHPFSAGIDKFKKLADSRILDRK